MTFDPGGFDDFGANDREQVRGSTHELSEPPLSWLYLGIGASVVGVALPLLIEGAAVAVLGWALGGIVAIVLMGVFIRSDAERHARGWARPSSSAGPLRVVLALTALAAVVANAWRVADVVARSGW